MSRKPEQLKADLIQKVIALAEAKVSGARLAALESFIEQYYLRAAPEDLLEHSPESLYGVVLAHWNFIHLRTPGEARIHVYNPSHEQHGWQTIHTVVEIVTDDMPFLVDSVRMAVNRLGLTLHLLIHPVLRVERDARGRLGAVVPAGAPAERGVQESLMHLQVDRQTDPAELARLHQTLEQVLADVRITVDDWSRMRERLETVIEGLERTPPPLNPADLNEARAFLSWLLDGHFTFVGYRHYRLLEEQGEDVLRALSGTGLGVLRRREEHEVSASFSALPEPLRRRAHEAELLVINKASAQSTVHRPVPLDYVGVKEFDSSGEVIGEHRFLGLYTSAAYNLSPSAIPLVRRKVARVMVRSGLAASSYAAKALLNIIDNFPRDELFQASEEELFDITLGILHLQERRRIRLFVRRDPFGRFFSCLVFVPRDRYDTALRIKMQGILQEAFGGTRAEFNTRFSESVLARIHFTIHTPVGSEPAYEVREIEQRLQESARSWADDFQQALMEHFGEERGNRLLSSYQHAFPAGYREIHPAWTAVYDVEHITRLPADGPGLSLYRPLEETGGNLHFKLFARGAPIPLSDALPVLENMGLRVVGEQPFEVRPAGADPVWIHDFLMVFARGPEPDPEVVRTIFQEAFAGIWRGDIENDGFNRLVLEARLSGREVALLRAYCRYLLQTGIPFSQSYMEQTLANNPEIARMLVRLFQARAKPQEKVHADARAARLEKMLAETLDAVANLDEDRILRRFLAVIRATLRTNWYQRGPSGSPKPYLSIKLDPARIPDLPLPRPMFEIFVYSPRVEGVHLRGGKVARGGLRWSDRREDYRTEVLGLMKAQMVKNAVIVPVGAKGGFVCKRLPVDGDREALQGEVVASYQTFVRGLLDLTDNLVQGRVVPPEGVVRHDDDDPYLVVAADKGTATFSDTANAIAREYGFWLGDAFASGGSAGYDHKKIGITARGAWESVKRHFRELGRDIQSSPFTVVGIGDMSGDVFGNGMLLSPHIRLVAAFNHLHIFLDPNPDPETGFHERQRLFALPRSSWADYDRTLLSRGGGIHLRTQKSIALSPEVRELLGVSTEHLTPNELIRLLLTAPVDLLWNGGIGTYVKGAGERHADVGDRANDGVRVDGRDLRCRVVGEGGNLGFTQLGRVEYAAAGGRMNTDFIDNSGGVDCSDREVNIKILLNAVVDSGDLTGKQRNQLLAEMTGEVAAQVVRDNYAQSQTLSLMAFQAPQLLTEHSRYLHALEKGGVLDRALEGLPGDEELTERQAADQGLTRPELAVLFAYSKIHLYGQLLESDLPDDPGVAVLLERYFPTPLRERFQARMGEHRLRREIIAGQITNQLVNRMGPLYAHRLEEATGAGAANLARAFVWGCEVYGAEALWEAIEALDNRAPAELQLDMLRNTAWLVERAALWFLRRYRSCPDVAGTLARFRPRVAEIAADLPRLLVAEERQGLRRQAKALAKKGVPAALAGQVAGLGQLPSALDIVEVAGENGADVKTVAHLYFHLGDVLETWWLRQHIAALPQQNYWQTRARTALRDELLEQQAALTMATLALAPQEESTAARLRAWKGCCEPFLGRWEQVLGELKAATSVSYEMLTVAVQELRELVSACQPGTDQACEVVLETEPDPAGDD